MKRLQKLLPIQFILLLAACGGSGGGSGGGGSGPVPVDDRAAQETNTADGVNFTELKSAVITPRCSRCHADFQNQSGFNTRIVPGNPEASRAFQLASNGTMPKEGPPLTSAELEVMRLYIEDTASHASSLVEFE